MSVSVERAGLSDAAAIDELERVLFPHDAWPRDLIDSELRHPDSYYVALRDTESKDLIGYGGLRASPSLGGQGDIQTMAIATSHQGQGLGTLLLDTLLAEAWKRNIDEVFLDVRADNDVAQALYRRAGFREIARRPGYYQAGLVDAIVMRKSRDDKEPTHG